MTYRTIFIASLIVTFLISCKAQSNNGSNDNKQELALNENIVNKLSSTNNDISNSRRNAITDAIAICSPAIVGINVTEVRQVVYRNPFFDDPMFRRFFGGNQGSSVREYEVQGLGSGFIISPDGYILSNHHVAGNASKIIVTMTDGTKHEAEIIGSDMVTDVALLKIKGNNLPYLKLGTSNDVIIGEWVIAFGNPFGLFDRNAKPTVTVGVVSNNNINILHQDSPYNRVYKGMIQTDAAISSGNSGGPLVNSLGEVIAMNTIIYSTSQNRQGAGSIGIGFSIPIDRVKKIVELLKSKSQIDRDYYTGIEPRELDEQLARYIGSNLQEGVVVFGMLNNSPAEKSGVKLGDVISEIDGYKILRLEDYLIATGDAVTGQTLNFKVLRDGKEQSVNLKLEQRPRR
ncbi:MAG: trypsin-like peptidase domain-containing protein [Desulfobulbaceae bacterium]|nr:trypsin-like peptidase domain-containing protein [Candidatus Kapabacteria bacterium]MBS4000309.1 trypsin-like peptidase domain-containing protein [Desulfobulbaceae bacterium]